MQNFAHTDLAEVVGRAADGRVLTSNDTNHRFSMSVAAGAAFLDRSVHGHCGITGSSEGDCEIGLNGAFGLKAADVQGGWKGAAAACVARCQGCARCRFVTVSLQYKDCSWYHACDLPSIKPEKLFTPEFSTNSMLDVLDKLSPEDSGGFFAYDGSKIEY